MLRFVTGEEQLNPVCSQIELERLLLVYAKHLFTGRIVRWSQNGNNNFAVRRKPLGAKLEFAVSSGWFWFFFIWLRQSYRKFPHFPIRKLNRRSNPTQKAIAHSLPGL